MAALQAYHENISFRRSPKPAGSDMQLYRRSDRTWLASFFLLVPTWWASSTAAAAPNPVVLSGDIHCALVRDVKRDFEDPARGTVTAEFVRTSLATPMIDSTSTRLE